MRIVRGLADLVLAAFVVAELGGLGGFGARAHADPTPDPKIQKADQLFAEGKALLSSNLLQACEKFKESLQENPAAIGTLLNVALCDEKLGRVASAVSKFSEVRIQGKEQGLPEHVRAAEEHLKELTPKVPHLTIQLTEQLPETKILLDDTLLTLNALVNHPVDPGELVIVVSAPTRLPYRAKVTIGVAEHKDVVIPALAKSVTIRSSRGRIGQITTIIGGATIGTGLGLGLYARHLYNKQFDDGRCQHTDMGDLCQASGQSRTERARTFGNIGTVVGVAGVLAAGLGAYLWVRSPSDTSDKNLIVMPQVSPDGLGIAAVGRF
jgi:hypothetical protein